jgi:hypothetical protein
MSEKQIFGKTIVAAIAFGMLSIATVVVAQRTARTSSSPIREDALRAHIKFLSDDRLEGRGTGARGGELAALYIAQQFEAFGLKGAGAKGSFWQPASLVGVKADPKSELRVTGSKGSEAFKFADDFVAFTGAQTEHVDANTELVFVGYGIDAPEQKWNDYKGPADGLSRQDSRHARQRSTRDGCRTRFVWRSSPDLFGPLDLQIRRSRASRSGRRDSPAHERVGRLSVECRAYFEWFLAI